jgi:mRNA interferase YafQ
MFEIEITGSFKKDLKTLKKRSFSDFEILRIFIKNLSLSGFDGIDKKHNPHKLKGKFAKHNECHVMPDLLLIWMEDRAALKITLIRTGTHSDLF